MSGGGAKGLYHIGVLEALEENGVPIDYVAGTSMGALVGGMYASGHLEPFKEWMCALDRYKVFGLVDFTLSPEGLVKGDRVMRAMQELVPDVRIEQMPVPFAAVAADLVTGREVVLDRGGLYDAIRASISIPSVFRPVHRDGMVLVDGGMVNPVPYDRVRRSEGDLLVAVDVCAPFGGIRLSGPACRSTITRCWSPRRRSCSSGSPRCSAACVLPTSSWRCRPIASACSNSTARRRLSRRDARRCVRPSAVLPNGRRMAWNLLRHKEVAAARFFEEFKKRKSSDATSHRFLRPPQRISDPGRFRTLPRFFREQR